MACDSAYEAYLKAYYPFEFYKTILKLYDEKGNKDKIVSIIQEMKQYKSIKFIPCLYGQNNTDWTIDKENNSLYSSLSSIKFMSKAVAKDLLKTSKQKFKYFVDVLRYLQMNTCIDERQITILICLGYFSPFYKTGKCLFIAREFFEGASKLTKNYVEKTVQKRLPELYTIEENCADFDLDIMKRIDTEYRNVGMCLSLGNDYENKNWYYVKEADTDHGIKIHLYNILTGNNSIVRVSKATFEKNPIESNSALHIKSCRKSPKKTFKNGKMTTVPNEFEFWLQDYESNKISAVKIKVKDDE